MDKLLSVVEDEAIRAVVKNYFSEGFRQYASNGATREFKAGFVGLLEVLDGEKSYHDVDREIGAHLEKIPQDSPESKAMKELRFALRDATAEKQVRNEQRYKGYAPTSSSEKVDRFRDALFVNKDI